MNIHEVFTSTYLKAEDLQGKRHRLTIAKVVIEEVGREGAERQEKPVLYFQGAKKGLVLNKTNAIALADAFGGDTDAWVSQIVELFPTKVNYQGRMVDGIRLDAIKEPQKQVDLARQANSAEMPNGSLARDLNDSIPF